MRLLILDQFSDPGGAQQCLLDLLPEIRSRGWEALIGLPGEGEMFDHVRCLGFDAERIPCGPYHSGRKSVVDAGRFLWQAPYLRWQIRRMAERLDADLIYVNGPRLLPAIPGGFPVAFHAHSYIRPGPVRDLAGLALRRSGAPIIANCRYVAETWSGYVPPERISIVYNGVGQALSPVNAAGQPSLACIGRIAPEKGQLEFVAAAALIHRAFPSARFEIIGAPLFGDPAGPRYYASVREAAADLPVTFRGWVDDIYAALSGIDLLLVPSAPHEATTRVILEAYAAGVPVIAFPSGGIPEVVEDGVTGYLAESVAEMAQSAIEWIRNSARRADLSHGARECWARRFTLQRYRREALSCLERAAAAGTGPRPRVPAPPRPSGSIRIPGA